jgi:hypothetical protein
MLFFSITWLDARAILLGCRRLCLFCGFFLSALLVAIPATPQDPPPDTSPLGASDLFGRVIANQKKSEATLDQYERTQRVERRKTGSDQEPLDTKVLRNFPTGPGVNKITLSIDGRPINAESYLSDLQRLEKYLAWAAEEGPAQKEAYARAERKRKDRFDLIEATHEAFRFTLEGKEMRGDRALLRYSMTPNPQYKPTSRNTTLFTKVRGTLWIDEQSLELAKVEGVVTEDVSLALFLAKVYKGSHFMQERYEIAPGIWEPTFEQYDFEGRKFLTQFSIHERTTYTNYKRVGPPKEAVEVVRAELNKLEAEQPAQ